VASHCDIAWAGALATHAHTQQDRTPGAAVGCGNGIIGMDGVWRPLNTNPQMTQEENERRMILSDDPKIWKPLRY
jgi:hypothetical protein